MKRRYRLSQVSLTEWQLDVAIDDGWKFVGVFDSEDAAQTKLVELAAADA
jgi:hypothetical protein